MFVLALTWIKEQETTAAVVFNVTSGHMIDASSLLKWASSVGVITIGTIARVKWA